MKNTDIKMLLSEVLVQLKSELAGTEESLARIQDELEQNECFADFDYYEDVGYENGRMSAYSNSILLITELLRKLD